MSDTDRERWDARYRERAGAIGEPSPFLTSLAGVLPRSGSALDVAGGSGRHALWLAAHGLTVTLADVSPVALETARSAAQARGLSLATVTVDLEREALPGGPWDVILSCHYLNRALFGQFPARLKPGGLLVFVQPTRRNLERHPHPGPAYLLEDGELPGLVSGLEVWRYEEGWLDEGRHEARLVARRP